MSVILNPFEGVAKIGQLQVSIQLIGQNGALQINGDQGLCLSPISFIERSRIASYAIVSKNPTQAMAKLVTEASLLNPEQSANKTDPVIVSIIAMVLAGANEKNMPSFAESILLVSQNSGWCPDQLGQSNAVDVDKLVLQLVPDSDDGWIHLTFNDTEETDLNLISNELADNLLTRLQSKHDILQKTDQSRNYFATSNSDMLSSHIQLEEQQTAIKKSLSNQKLEIHSDASESKEYFTSTVDEAGGIREEKNNIPSLSNEINNRTWIKSIPLKSGLSDKNKFSNSYIKSSVENEKNEALKVNGKPVETKTVKLSKNNQSFSSQHKETELDINNEISKATTISPVFNKNNLTTSPGKISATTSVESRPSFHVTDSASSLSATLYPDNLANATQIYGQFNNTITDSTPLHTPLFPKAVNDEANGIDVITDEIMDELAIRLHLEADLRGIDR